MPDRTGQRIRQRRLDLGLRQAQLAGAAGISAPYLNLIEHGRRRIGGRLLVALARALQVEPAALAEGAEADTVAVLEAVAAAAGTDAGAPDPTEAAALAARFPAWARLIAAQSDRVRLLEESIAALSDRLSSDPRLSGALHEVLSTVTAIRSTAAILNETPDLDAAWRGRFQRNLDADGRRLAEAAEGLVAYLSGEAAGDAGEAAQATPHEGFAAWLAAGAGALPEAPEARQLAEAWQRQAGRDAAALPEAPLREALAAGAAPDALAARFGAPLSAVFRRLAALPGAGYGLIRADAAGGLLLLAPPPGFRVPRLGAACPLWPLFLALSRPMQPLVGLIEQAGRLPARFRYWALAEPAAPPGFAATPFSAAMLLRPATADEAAAPAEPVGIACRVCPRDGCPARREASVLPG